MFINWKEREIHIKLVYYGPALSGKTTNLEKIHQRVPQNKRSELVSVKTREDRTLFFDFMQLDLGKVKGLQPKFKLYTVPGQVYYAATRKLVLRDVDGLIFVADSSIKRLAANRQSLQDMKSHINQLGRSFDDLPFLLQCNKQDLPDAVQPDLLGRFLTIPEDDVVSAVALQGHGTTETLKKIIAKVMTQI